jgi:phage tail sheath protein FI
LLWVGQQNTLCDNQIETFVPRGAIAGILARTDSERGMWKIAAGLEAIKYGASNLSVSLTNQENGEFKKSLIAL